MIRCRPSLGYHVAGAVLGLSALLMWTPPAFAAGRSVTPRPEQIPANFQNLPGPQAVVAVPTDLLDPDPDHVRMRFYDPPLELGSVSLAGAEYQSVRLSGESATVEPGMPDIPRVTRLLMIGNTGSVEPVIVEQSYYVLENVLPPPMQPLNGDEGFDSRFPIPPEVEIYSRDAWYPSEVATVSTPATLRDVRFVILTIYPVQVNPVTHEMRVYDNLDVRVDNVGGIGENEIHVHPTSISPSFKKLYSTFENFEGSALDALPVFPGNYLVLCNNDATVIAEAQKLVNWQKRKGLNASYIASSLGTSSSATVRTTISNQYTASNGQLEFVCLLGDPGRTDAYGCPTGGGQYDNYYGTITADSTGNPDPVPDISIGRISMTSSGDLQSVVAKTVNYQTAPTESPNTTWFTQTWCATHTQDGIASNPSTKQYTRQIMLLDSIANVFWNVYGGSLVNADVLSRLNSGISCFNHRMSVIGESGSAPSWTAIDNLPTTGRNPFVMAVTCGTGNFDYEFSLSENWLMPDGQTIASPKGAIGCVSMATSSTQVPFNNMIDAGAMWGLYSIDVQEQGTALIAGKLQLYKNYWNLGGFNGNVQNFSYWSNLMGDPGVPIWRKFPRHVTVTRPASIVRGTNNVTVALHDSITGNAIPGALVCFLKGTETWTRGYTGADGSINLPCSTPTTGYLNVTITKENVRPYLDSIQVVTSLASLAYNSTTVDDDNIGGTIGDNNHVLNPGETIDLTVNLTNAGTTNTVTGISSTLTTTSAGIQITQATSAYLNIAPGANANNTTAFRFSVTSVFNNEPVTFYLNLTSSVGPQTVRLDFTPTAADVAYGSSTFSGGTPDPGESGNLTVTYRNSGNRSLLSSAGRLRSRDVYVTVTDSVGIFGTVTPGANGTNAADPFAINVSAGAFNGDSARMQLLITDANGFRDSTDFRLVIGNQTSTSPSGPDGYGYFAYDNTETTPPGGASTYSWIEIAPSQGGTGTTFNFNDQSEDQDDYTTVTLPFNFTFYGQTFSQITACTNGWIAFGSYLMWDYRNFRMGSPLGPPFMVAAYWDNLKVWGTDNNTYYKYDAVNHWYIVEWRAQTQWTPVLNEFFEIILYDPAYYPTASGNGKIKVQYQVFNLSANQSPGDYLGQPTEPNYQSVGIQNGDHSIGLDYTYWNLYSPGSTTLANLRSIMFTTDGNGQLNPGITVNTPNGGENWFIGQPYNINWSSTAVSGNVNVSLNRNYPGLTWESVFSGTPNDGAELWTVTGGATTSNARIRVVSVSAPTIGDTSNANFTLTMPSLSLIYPNGGESLTIGAQILIQWSAVGAGASTVSLNRSYPGPTWDTLDANAGTETWWIVAGPSTGNARIRVISNALPSLGDTSAANFSIGVPPAIAHDPHPDQAPGTALFVARVTDDLPGFTTKLFHRPSGAGVYDSLTMISTGHPNEYSATTPPLASGRYEYFLRSTDPQGLSSFDPATGLHKFDVGYFGPNWLGCDDGTAESYNWVNGPGFRWAVKFIPSSYPFALSGARFAICPTCPQSEHDPVVFKIYLADGPGGLPGTVVFTDTTGPAGNNVGGLPAGAAWSDVVTRVAGQSLTLNTSFYLSVENSSPRIYPVAFGRDTTGVRCHLSYFWDECEQMWHNEDEVLDNARPGNRMIRANGFVLTPPTIVSHRSNNDVILNWTSTGAPYYRVFWDSVPNGSFGNVLGSTTSSSFTDVNAVNLNLKRFYRVVSSDGP